MGEGLAQEVVVIGELFLLQSEAADHLAERGRERPGERGDAPSARRRPVRGYGLDELFH